MLVSVVRCTSLLLEGLTVLKTAKFCTTEIKRKSQKDKMAKWPLYLPLWCNSSVYELRLIYLILQPCLSIRASSLSQSPSTRSTK